MKKNEHARIEEAIAASVLDPTGGSVDNGSVVLDHLSSCESCQRLYRELREVAGDLSIAATPLALSSAVEDRVMTAIRGEPQEQAVARAPRKGRPRLLIAAALMVATALGGTSVKLAGDLGDARAELRALAIVTAADADVTTLHERGGPGVITVGVLDDGRAALVGSKLTVAEDRVLELWIQRGTTMIPAAIFTPDAGRAVLEFTFDPERDVAVAVTVERRFEQAPTRDPIFIGTIGA